MPGGSKRASERRKNHKICFDKGGLWRAYVSAGGIERRKKKSWLFHSFADLSFLFRLMLPCLATIKELAQAINTSQGGVLGVMGRRNMKMKSKGTYPGMLRVLEPKRGKEWGMKRIERSRRRVGTRNREEIDGVDEKKGRNGGEDVAAMWCGGGGGGGGCGCVGVCVCGLQISARESGTPHTKNLRHSTNGNS